MITIVNFSHPVHDDRPDIKLTVGDVYKTIDVKVHLDQDLPTLLPAIDSIIYETTRLAGGNIKDIDCIILPGLSIAAVMIIEEFRRAGYIPNILRMAPASKALPPRFEAVEVVRLRQPRVEEAEEGSFGSVRAGRLKP